MRGIITLLVAIFLIVGCKKKEDKSCLKSTGEMASKEVVLDAFDKLYMGPHLKYELVQDTVNKVVLKGGAYLLNGISLQIDDENRLVITNENNCAFLRPYDEIVVVEIHFVNLININFEGTQEVLCEDTLAVTDLSLTIRDGAGHFNLKVHGNSLDLLITHGWGNYTVAGIVNYAKFNLNSNGFGDAYNLQVNNELIAISSTVGIMKIRADNCDLLAETNQTGDIWYKGAPNIVAYNQYGSGALINKN